MYVGMHECMLRSGAFYLYRVSGYVFEPKISYLCDDDSFNFSEYFIIKQGGVGIDNHAKLLPLKRKCHAHTYFTLLFASKVCGDKILELTRITK